MSAIATQAANSNNLKNNSNVTVTAFPYTLQPQPPPHPKTTGGKRGPSAPITIPSLAKGMRDESSGIDDDDDEDSDISITDHTPPSQTKLIPLVSEAHSPMSGSPASTGLRGTGVAQLPSPRALTTVPNPVPVLSTKTFTQATTSPRTNNNTSTLNRNHHMPSAFSSSAATSSSTFANTTPILIIHSNNVSTKAGSITENCSNTSNPSSSAVTSGGLPVPGCGFLGSHGSNVPSSNAGTSLTASHPPAPWVAPQSTKLNSLGPSTISTSKVPRLVDQPLQQKDGILTSTATITDKHPPSFLPTDQSLASHTPQSAASPGSLPSSNINKSTPTLGSSLTVGIPESPPSTKISEHCGPSALLMSPSDVRTGSPEDGDIRASSPISSSSNSCFAYELDHDYENVASPSSSTASGPIYVRQPGFKHHAHEVTVSANTGSSVSSAVTAPPPASLFTASLSNTGSDRNGASHLHSFHRFKQKKKCSATLVNLREAYKKREATPPKLKPKREPLPMKLRALPQSFWQQPNVAHQVSPATLFPVLPPLANKEAEEALMEVRPVTPPEEREATRKTQQPPERKLTVANTDLLFKLFEVVADDKKGSVHKARQQNKPSRKPMPKSNTKGLFLGNDPYMVEAVTEKIFPQLTLEGGPKGTGYQGAGAGNSSLQLISLKEGDRTVQLPSLSMEQNYPQMLSELVMHI